MKLVRLALLSMLIVWSFAGCEKRDPNAMRKVHWDRDMCERCKMVVSDRKHTVQVIQPKTGRSYMFDDIGCMVLWLHEEQIEWASSAKIWITDSTTGDWIDARTAYYDTSCITPMAFGFGVHKTKDSIKDGEEVIDFAEASRRIFKIEEKNTGRKY